jgi:NRPS condensation-like uncharacterized protein
LQEQYNGQTLLIWKQHHSLGDGASCMAFMLSLTDEYNTDSMVSIRKIGILQKILLNLSLPLNMIRVFLSFISQPIKVNPLHDGKRDLSGIKHVSTSKDYKLKDIKELSKRLNLTINDILTACLASGVKSYFTI